MNVQDPEALIQCPYDKVHMIRRKRLPYHLQKCRRNYVGKAFKVCPFNARHEVPEPEFHHHLVHCPNKGMVEKDMIHIKRLQEDPAYREKFEGGIMRSSPSFGSMTARQEEDDQYQDHVNNQWSDEERDSGSVSSLSRAFDQNLRLENHRPPPREPNWFDNDGSPTPDDSSYSQSRRQYHDISSAQDSSQQRRQQRSFDHGNGYDERGETSDYGSDGFEGSAFGGSTESAAKPLTEPVALKMIKAFGRGSHVHVGDGDHVGFGAHARQEGGEDGDNAAAFGARFPPSLGRGVMRGGVTPTVAERSPSLGHAVGQGTTTAYQAAMKQRVLESLDAGTFDDAADAGNEASWTAHADRRGDQSRRYSPPYRNSSYQEENHQREYQQRQYRQYQQHQRQDQRFGRAESPQPELKTADDQQWGYSSFPAFQRGETPRYSSTFCADRPLSKQAQIQLAQQQQMANNPSRFVKRGKRGKFAVGGSRRFQFSQPQSQPPPQQHPEVGGHHDWEAGEEDARKFAFGRGVGLGRGVSYD